MMSMSMPPSSGSGISISGPPPGLGLPLLGGNGSAQGSGNNPNSRAGSYAMGGADNENNGHSTFGPGMGGMGLNNSLNKPLDINSMMSALDFYGPSSSGGSSSGTLANNWSMPNGNAHHPSYLQQQHLLHLQQGLNSPTNSNNGQGAPGHGPRRESAQSNVSLSMNGGPQQQYQQLQQQQQQHHHHHHQQQQQQHPQQQQQQQGFSNGLDHGSNNDSTSNDNSNNTSEVNTAQSTPHMSNNVAGAAAATARSVEDLELQVINAKMETQMLENQLNAVIKRNRRKLYA
jgi:hypothetical protein